MPALLFVFYRCLHLSLSVSGALISLNYFEVLLLVPHLVLADRCIHGLQIFLKQELDGSVDQLVLFLRLNNKNLIC